MTKVVFIAGCWRSGSTVFGDVLAARKGYAHGGELQHVWSRGLQRNWLCGCGERFLQCEFWREVMRPWAGRAAEFEAARKAALDEIRDVVEALESLRRHEDYLRQVVMLLERLLRESGAIGLIDSSKSFRQGAILLAAGADVEVVHLVRDPRDVVHSLVNRPKERADDPEGSRMIRLEPEQAIGHWLASNRQAEALGRLAGAYSLVRYEDFVRNPGGEPAVGHTISGNPGRLEGGGVQRLEVERSAHLDRLVESRVGLGLARYGYESR